MARRGTTVLRWLACAVACACPLWLGSAVGWAAGSLVVTVSGVTPGGAIPQRYAYCVPAPTGHVMAGPNVSPAIRWTAGPSGTASYAIIVRDPDVPSVFADANREGRTIPDSLPRVDFYHWVFVDIPSATRGLPESADSNGVVPQGKAPGPTRYGVRGVNGFSPANGGYDGPCPPWNDERAHHYHFTVYALDVARLATSGTATGPEALRAMQGHVLASGEVVGVYTLNPDVAKRLGIR